MPAVYENGGLRFQYPDNWELEPSDAVRRGISVSVASPGGAFWSLTVQPADIGPAEMSATAIEALQQEYDSLESEAVSDSIHGHDAVGYDVHFIYLDLTITAVIRAFRTATATYLVHLQAEDDEYDRNKEVFRAITASLMMDRRPVPDDE